MIYKKIEIKVEGYQETADLYTYILDNSVEMHPDRKRPVVVICPGGGYEMTSDREAEPIAMQYLARGYHAVILRYSVEPARYPLALLQLAKSVAFLRKNAAEFHIDTNKIVLQGFSAGGHLAAKDGKTKLRKVAVNIPQKLAEWGVEMEKMMKYTGGTYDL